MSHWMTSGAYRLKARQKKKFAINAQKRASVVSSALDPITSGQNARKRPPRKRVAVGDTVSATMLGIPRGVAVHVSSHDPRNWHEQGRHQVPLRNRNHMMPHTDQEYVAASRRTEHYHPDYHYNERNWNHTGDHSHFHWNNSRQFNDSPPPVPGGYPTAFHETPSLTESDPFLDTINGQDSTQLLQFERLQGIFPQPQPQPQMRHSPDEMDQWLSRLSTGEKQREREQYAGTIYPTAPHLEPLPIPRSLEEAFQENQVPRKSRKRRNSSSSFSSLTDPFPSNHSTQPIAHAFRLGKRKLPRTEREYIPPPRVDESPTFSQSSPTEVGVSRPAKRPAFIRFFNNGIEVDKDGRPLSEQRSSSNSPKLAKNGPSDNLIAAAPTSDCTSIQALRDLEQHQHEIWDDVSADFYNRDNPRYR